MLPKSLKNLSEELGKLPGVGPKTALRYAYHFFYSPPEEVAALAKNLLRLHEETRWCSICGNAAETNPCFLCGDQTRDKELLCVVAHPRDIGNIEKTKVYRGHYHVLGGTISPIDGGTPERLRLQSLKTRLQNSSQIKEIILAFNPDIEGETTILYLARFLKEWPLVKISRLARGLPLGGELEYTDEVTLGEALKGRRNVL